MLNPITLVCCRVYQAVFTLAARLLPWRKAELIMGEGSLSRVTELLRREGVNKPMVVTGPLLKRTGLADRLLSVLDENGMPCALFSDVEANPSVNTAEAIALQYQKNNCSGFVAFGGGSPMDAAKAAAARIAMPRKSVRQLGGLLKVRNKIPVFVAIPTTAGTGSETTIAAVVTDPDTHRKYALMDLHLIPRYAVLDPALTLGLPPAVTAATGIDALTHAVEAYLCWTNNTAESRRAAQEAVTTIFANLEAAYRDGQNLEARMNMLYAAYQAGYAFTRAGVGNVHAIAHTLGGLYHTPHGLANAVLLPIVLEDYGKAVHKKLARLAALTGTASGQNDAENARAFIQAIRELNRRMGLPTGFDYIKEDDIAQMTAWALSEANPVYPVPVVYDKARCRRVIERLRRE